jgi:hypothetical protein
MHGYLFAHPDVDEAFQSGRRPGYHRSASNFMFIYVYSSNLAYYCHFGKPCVRQRVNYSNYQSCLIKSITFLSIGTCFIIELYGCFKILHLLKSPM